MEERETHDAIRKQCLTLMKVERKYMMDSNQAI